MYFQFLIEDKSTEILVSHVMNKLEKQHTEIPVYWKIKSFSGIGHLPKEGNVLERKTGKLLNDLAVYMRGIGKVLQEMQDAALVVVLDNDKRNTGEFRDELENLAISNMIFCDYVFCIAVKEMEAWLLGDTEAIRKAYPNAKMQYIKKYEQDAICDTWEILADMVYPQGLSKLRKKAGDAYAEIGRAKCEWADRIGRYLRLHGNNSPSYQYFINELERRIAV